MLDQTAVNRLITEPMVLIKSSLTTFTFHCVCASVVVRQACLRTCFSLYGAFCLAVHAHD